MLFRDKFGNDTIFVVASDNPAWAETFLGGNHNTVIVDFSSQRRPEWVTFAVLSSCNHSILR